jgi:hypothetical protein
MAGRRRQLYTRGENEEIEGTGKGERIMEVVIKGDPGF